MRPLGLASGLVEGVPVESIPVVGSAAQETGPPELREGLDPLDVSPGLLGFAVMFAVVLACIPLFRSMTGKLRKVDQRAPGEEEDLPDGSPPPQQPQPPQP